MIQGQSSATIIKEATIQTFIQWSIAITKPTQYYVFDLNCGCGENRHNGANCRGTAVLMREALQKRGISGRMWLVDKSRKFLACAKSNFFNPQFNLFDSDNSIAGITATFHLADNRDFAPTITARLQEENINPRFAHGVIICDPNGLEVPLRAIGESIKEAPKMDVVIHLCNMARVWACKRKHPDMQQMKNMNSKVLSFAEIFETIKKNTWLVTELYPKEGKPNRNHILLFGTNLYHQKQSVAFKGRAIIYRHDSIEGKSLIANLDRFSAEVA